ncbi:uncharacterized protein LOC105696782 [Orussus abietinus]|uniref:uncharacterized protein LOC105696782 n=1 Tax=Orussus abietinus TaxID=222816 RepID=UPI00062518AC|nr:uncharacterized protein LOC105696782 [Orussus abietinus]
MRGKFQTSTGYEDEGEMNSRGKGRKPERHKKRRKDPGMMFTSTLDLYNRPLKWWETEPVKYAPSYPAVRARLEMLMGSNVVRLTDRKYMLHLMARIRQDYERQQQIRVEERKKCELMRTKKMILNRLIPVQEAPPEIKKYPLFQLYLYCDAIIEERRRKRQPKKTKITKSLYNLLYPEEKDEEGEEEDKDEEIYMRKVYVNGEPQLIPMSPQEVADLKKTQETKDIDDGYTLSPEEYDRLRYETDSVKELRECHTVEDMYVKAHEIVGILYSYADEGRYKIADKDSVKTGDQKNAPETSNQAETGN